LIERERCHLRPGAAAMALYPQMPGQTRRDNMFFLLPCQSGVCRVENAVSPSIFSR
jgi:hypothetical protein